MFGAVHISLMSSIFEPIVCYIFTQGKMLVFIVFKLHYHNTGVRCEVNVKWRQGMDETCRILTGGSKPSGTGL